MLSVYLLFFTFKVVATLACVVYCYRIARLNLTPTFTYMLFCVAFALRVVTQIRAAFYTMEIVAIWRGHAVAHIISSQAIETAIIACFLIGFARTYYGCTSLLGTRRS